MKAVRAFLLCLACLPAGALPLAADDGAPPEAGMEASAPAAPPLIVPYFSPAFGVRPMESAPVTPATLPDVRPSLSPLLSFRPPVVQLSPARPASPAVPVQVLPTLSPAPVPLAAEPASSSAVPAAPAPAPAEVPASTASPVTPVTSGTGNYAIHPGDTLTVTIAGETDFDGRAVVQNSGVIALPYVQEIKVAGMTIAEATTEITRRLSEYYVNPVVTVDVAGYRKKEYVILGQVNLPGVYPFGADEDSMSLMEAIAKAGGVKQYGDLGHVSIKRVVDGKEQILTVNAQDAKALSRNLEGLNFQVLPGDSIVITVFRNEINLLGEVQRPGIYTLPPLLDSIDLIEAIAMAGGTVEGEDLGIVHVKRQVDGKMTTINVNAKDIGRVKPDANFPVYAGDTLIVETMAKEFIVLGQVNRPGSYRIPPLRDTVDLIEAIAMAGGATRLADTAHITIRRIVDGKTKIIKADALKLARSASADQVDVMPGDRIVISERMF